MIRTDTTVYSASRAAVVSPLVSRILDRSRPAARRLSHAIERPEFHEPIRALANGPVRPSFRHCDRTAAETPREGVSDDCRTPFHHWGWYSDEKDWPAFLEELRDKYESKPMIISEFGAGAVPGERTMESQKWSEPYQRRPLTDAIETSQDTEFVAEFTIWQYCDIRVPPRKAMARPRTHNNKGIVDEYRRPKDAYWAVKDLFTEL